MWTLVRQWRQKRVLVRPEAAFPYVFAAEGAQHPLIKPPRSTSCHALRPAATAAAGGTILFCRYENLNRTRSVVVAGTAATPPITKKKDDIS